MIDEVVCPECGSSNWSVIDETDEFAVCDGEECGLELHLSDLISRDEWEAQVEAAAEARAGTP